MDGNKQLSSLTTCGKIKNVYDDNINIIILIMSISSAEKLQKGRLKRMTFLTLVIIVPMTRRRWRKRSHVVNVAAQFGGIIFWKLVAVRK